jgi:hypothetical protein
MVTCAEQQDSFDSFINKDMNNKTTMEIKRQKIHKRVVTEGEIKEKAFRKTV